MVAEINIWFGAKITINIVSAYIFIRIWKYLDKKPFGMQTLLDELIKDHIRLMSIAMIVTTLPFVQIKEVSPAIEDSTSHNLTVAILYAFNFTIMAVFVQILASTIIKYLAIFHQGTLNEVDDMKIVRGTRFVIGMSAFTSAAVTGVGYKSALYAHISGNEVNELIVPNHYAFKSILILDAIVLGFVQGRIEMYKRKIKNNLANQSEAVEQGINNNEQTDDFKIDFSLARKIASCVSLSVFFLLRFFLDSVYENENLKEKFSKVMRTTTITNFILFLVIPLVFIIKTDNLYKFVIKPFKK